MDIRNLKHAHEVLIDCTQDEDISSKIENKIEQWGLIQLVDSFHDTICKLKDLYIHIYEDIFDEEDDVKQRALHWVVFNKIHDMFMPALKTMHRDEDLYFFEKSKSLCIMEVSAEQLGADKNLSIPLSAAIVELSVLDTYKSPIEKMNCLCGTYDLVFAELKTAFVSVISKSSDEEVEIPVLNNDDVIPLIMLVTIKSKLVYLHSNITYIKYFYHKLDENRVVHNIFTAFETAVNNLREIDEDTLKPDCDKIKQSMDVVEFMRMSSETDEKLHNKTLLDEERERILNLITISTSEDQIM